MMFNGGEAKSYELLEGTTIANNTNLQVTISHLLNRALIRRIRRDKRQGRSDKSKYLYKFRDQKNNKIKSIILEHYGENALHER